MSLQKMERETGDKFAKHMLRYISFLYPDKIDLNFLVNLNYDFETIWEKLQKLILWNLDLRSGNSDLSKTVDLLCSYSLIAVDASNNKITVHRVVQDAMRFMTPQTKALYLQKLLSSLTFSSKQEYSENLLHLLTVSRHWNIQALQEFSEKLLGKFTRRKNAAGDAAPLESDPNIQLSFTFIHLTIPFVNAMKCDNPVQNYLDIYNKVTAAGYAIRRSELANMMLTNYTVLANFIITKEHNRIFQNVFECVTLFRMREFQIAFLLDLLGMQDSSEVVFDFLDLLVRLGMLDISICSLYAIFEVHYDCLFEFSSPIPESIITDYSCLKYLKTSFTDDGNDNRFVSKVGTSSWNYKTSAAWPLIQQLDFKIEAVRSAIAYINFSSSTIDDYLENFKTYYKLEQEYKIPEIVTQFINAKYLREELSNEYFVLVLICCLRPECEEDKLKFIFTANNKEVKFNMFILDSFQMITMQNYLYFIDENLQTALRKRILSKEEKKWAMKVLHEACLASVDVGYIHENLVDDWNHLMEQEDLNALVFDMGLSMSN